MRIVIDPDLSEQPGGSFAAHIKTIGALPEKLADTFWRQVKTAEDLGEGLIEDCNSGFVLTKNYQQGVRALLEHLQAKYSIIAEWLNYSLYNKEAEGLFNTKKIYYRPFGTYLLARLPLCQEIYPKVPKLLALPSPAGCWVNWIASELWWELYQLFQNKRSYQGKREWYDLARQASNPYEFQHEHERIPKPLPLKQETALLKEPKEIEPALLALFLEVLCANTARDDPKFDREHYSKYLRDQKAFHNICRNLPSLQIGSVNAEGELQLSQKDKQISKSRKRRRM